MAWPSPPSLYPNDADLFFADSFAEVLNFRRSSHWPHLISTVRPCGPQLTQASATPVSAPVEGSAEALKLSFLPAND